MRRVEVTNEDALVSKHLHALGAVKRPVLPPSLVTFHVCAPGVYSIRLARNTSMTFPCLGLGCGILLWSEQLGLSLMGEYRDHAVFSVHTGHWADWCVMQKQAGFWSGAECDGCEN